MIRRYLPKSTEELIRWYERRVAPFSLLAGFIADNILFRAIDLFTTTIALALYLTLVVVGIFTLNFVETGRIKYSLVLKVAPFLPVVVQFAFGAIFSAFFVLYSESATLAVSWISVGILAALLVGNERFRTRYRNFSFQVGVLYVALVGLLIFLLPFLFKRIGPEMFFASLAVSTGLIALYLWGAHRVMPELVRENLTRIARTVVVIFLIFNVLYFTNAIPPLPLALKEADVYHKVERVGDEYRALYEKNPWYREYLPLRSIVHRAPGEPLYVFSAVFAPSGLSTVLTHEWQHFDENIDAWKTITTVEFPVAGGRDGGYRGFSTTASQREGKWRVNVLTPHGQVVGRVSFTVINVSEPPSLKEKML